jgi:CARDB
MRRITITVRCALASALVAAAGAAWVSPADAKKHAVRPDLVELSVSNPTPASAKAGESFTVSDVVKNKGRKLAPKSVTTFCLNGRPTTDACGLVAGTRNVPPLKSGKQSGATAHLKIPQQLADQPGTTWSLLACSDGPRKLKESNEKNNCKLSAGKITVVGGDPPTQHGSPGLQGAGTFSFDPNPDRSDTVDFSVSFNQAVSGFSIWVPRDQVFAAHLTSRQDGSCSQTSEEGPFNGTKYAVVFCSLSSSDDMFAANEQITGTILPDKPPSAGMGGKLYAYVADPNDSEAPGKTTGPFQITGP